MARRSLPENPFPAGTIVTGDDFADRQDELTLLRDELLQGGPIFLLAYRRFGKSCLIHGALRRLEADDHALTAYVDLYRANSERELWELFTNALLAASRSPLKRLIEWVTDLARGFQPRFSIDPKTQQPVLTLDAPRTPAELAGVREWALQMPPKLVKQTARPLVIAFDELQEIRAYDGPRLEKTSGPLSRATGAWATSSPARSHTSCGRWRRKGAPSIASDA